MSHVLIHSMEFLRVIVIAGVYILIVDEAGIIEWVIDISLSLVFMEFPILSFCDNTVSFTPFNIRLSIIIHRSL